MLRCADCQIVTKILEDYYYCYNDMTANFQALASQDSSIHWNVTLYQPPAQHNIIEDSVLLWTIWQMLLTGHTMTVKNVQMISKSFALCPVSRNEKTQYIIHDKIKGRLYLGNDCITKMKLQNIAHL